MNNLLVLNYHIINLLSDGMEHISSGGSISIFQGTSEIEKSYFYENTADFGGAIYLRNTSMSIDKK